ncbi:MAG: short-chain dehydrogenase, partial [Acidimicrobiia bacterium]|nr:short-chain dehydrogenase [Acidimicrobiia bacterium]
MMSPRWIAPIVTWLASTQSAGVTGRVFEASGGVLAVAESWHRGPSATPVDDPTQIDAIARDLLAKARPNADMNGQDREG